MRIIAGEYRSRILQTPPDDTVTRPIPDRVKESLFNILRGHFAGANVFDGFAGTGAIGLECASRGAARVVCVEQDRGIVGVLRANVATLGCGDRVEVVHGDALGAGALARAPRPLQLAFLDPPYPLMRDPLQSRRILAQVAALVNLLTPTGFAVLRTPWPLFAEAQAAAAPEPRPVRRKPRREDWRRDVRDVLEGRTPPKRRVPDPDQDPDDDADGAVEEAGGAEAPAAATTGEPIKLELPGVRGPETHVYRQMAVHLYMRGS